MKKSLKKRIIALMMAWVMLLILPLANVAPVSEAAGNSASGEAVSNTTDDGSSGEDTDSDKTDAKNDKKESDKEDDISGIDKVYISEVRVGMGETDDEAKKELEAEGFTILKDDDGKNADLNKDAGSKSSLKRGANDKIVYLGYKTTTNPNDAITDLAVMNMNGGYSIEDYNALMDKQMDTQIKPFVDRFIATLNEYRTNYKKPKSSLNYKRANIIRQMLNQLTDDDTGGQPIGDLLLNKTKYEMGDAAYNALSDAEKKKHCDILTLLMQANGQATLTIESLLTQATDTGDDTWVDRFIDMTLEDLEEQIQEEDDSLNSRKDVLDALDRRYGDAAEELLKKWQVFKEKIENYEETAEDVLDNIDEIEEQVNEVKDMDVENASVEELEMSSDVSGQVFDQAMDSQIVAIGAYLDTTEYDGGSLRDFFEQDYDDVSSGTGIRKLYPLVEALTAGQIAGLEFVDFQQLFQIAISDENSFQSVQKTLSNVSSASVYDGVDREIYEKGGVALTNEALRAKAMAGEGEPQGYEPGALTISMWAVTAGFAAATVVAKTISKLTSSAAPTVTKEVIQKTAFNLTTDMAEMAAQKDVLNKMKDVLAKEMDSPTITPELYNQYYDKSRNLTKEIDKLATEMYDKNKELHALGKQEIVEKTAGTSMADKLAIGFAVITVIITVVSTVMTLLEAADFYDTEYIPMPRYIVEESDITATNAKGQETMIKNQTAYYKVVKCNRTAGDNKITKKNFEVMGDANDLNGDIGSQWYSLYSIKYVNGAPILADSLLYQINGTTVPDGYSTGIHDFGAKAACNLNKKAYLFRTNPPQIKVFFKRDKIAKDLKATGSMFTPGSMAIGGGMGLIVGALLGGVVVGRRKKKVEIEG